MYSVDQKGQYYGALWTILEQRINTEMFLDYNRNVFMPTIKWYRSATLKLSSHEPIKVFHFLKIRINFWISKKYLHNPTQHRHTLSRHNNHVNAVIYRFEQSKSKSIYGEQNVVRCWTIYADIFFICPAPPTQIAHQCSEAHFGVLYQPQRKKCGMFWRNESRAK